MGLAGGGSYAGHRTLDIVRWKTYGGQRMVAKCSDQLVAKHVPNILNVPHVPNVPNTNIVPGSETSWCDSCCFNRRLY